MVTGKKVTASIGLARKFAGLASDSREVKTGYLFAAIPGTMGDGANFVGDAVARGAVAVLGKPAIASVVAAAGVEFIPAENPRVALAEFAATFYGSQPATVAAVTGTNGKTSVTVFLREIWTAMGRRAASMGTIGVVTPAGLTKLNHTTPGPVEVQKILADVKLQGIDYLALEASSHGLDQYRLDGVDIAAVAFTNLTPDHRDYHPTVEHYLNAKLRLFRELARDDAVAVVDADSEYASAFVAAAAERGHRLITVGAGGGGIKLISRAAALDGQTLQVQFASKLYTIALPLAGAFQASNVLVAAGLAIGLGEPADAVFSALEHLKGAPGRLEMVAIAASGAPVFVDYAHTPDALENVLAALRSHTSRKLSVVFGCGGDRDKVKRAQMGEIAARLADAVVITDDNPRTELAAGIRAEILKGCPDATEIGDRAEAIRAAVSGLGVGDILVIAGKGHETGQTVGSTVFPFSDREVAVDVVEQLGGRGCRS